VTLRGVDWAVLLGGSAAGAGVLAGCVAAGAGGPPLTYVRLALVALAAAAAFVLDEPAAAAVDAVPASRRRRTTARVGAALIPFAVWTAGVAALERRSAVTPAWALLLEGAGVLAVAVAAAAVVRRAGRSEPGEAVAAALGAGLLAAVLFQPPPRSVPAFPVTDGWAASTVLWAVALTTAAVVVAAASADPYRRRRAGGRGD
jgi:hypothetical protein